MKRLKIAIICAAMTVISALALVGCGGRNVEIVFDGNGGTPATTTVVAVDGATLPGVPAPTRDGYYFTGWYTSPSCNESDKWRITDKVSGGTTLYAGWAEDSYITVKFDLGSGVTSDNAPQDLKLKTGSLVFEPVDPTRNGYIFKDWYKDNALTEKFDFSTNTVTSDTTIYARWAKVHTVTLKVGDASSEYKVEDGYTYSSVPAPSVDNKMFIGFYDSASFEHKLEFSDKVTGDNTVYAKLVAPTNTELYNIEVDESSDDGSGKKNGVAYVSTKEHLDELVLPSEVDGVRITGFYFRDHHRNEDDSVNEDRYLDADTVIFPASVQFIDSYSFSGMRMLAKSFDVEYSQNGRKSYNGYLYLTRHYWDSDTQKNIPTYYLNMFPRKDELVIDIMPGATIPDSIDDNPGYVFRFLAAPSEADIARGCFETYYSTALIVPDSYLAQYRQLAENSDNDISVFPESMYDAAKGMIFDEDTGTLYRYVGAKGKVSSEDPVVVGANDDGVLIIEDDAFYGYDFVTIGNAVTKIKGAINSEYQGGAKVIKLDGVFNDLTIDDFVKLFGEDRNSAFLLYIDETLYNAHRDEIRDCRDSNRFNCYIYSGGEYKTYEQYVNGGSGH